MIFPSDNSCWLHSRQNNQVVHWPALSSSFLFLNKQSKADFVALNDTVKFCQGIQLGYVVCRCDRSFGRLLSDWLPPQVKRKLVAGWRTYSSRLGHVALFFLFIRCSPLALFYLYFYYYTFIYSSIPIMALCCANQLVNCLRKLI